MSDIEFQWRGAFTNAEVNVLHADAFETRVFTDEEWDWVALTDRHSLGWVTARDGEDLVGFVNVVWDGLVHAWLHPHECGPDRPTVADDVGSRHAQ